MKRAVASVDLSLDGVIEHPEQWMFDHHDGEAAAYALISHHAAKAKFRLTNIRRCRPSERIDHVH